MRGIMLPNAAEIAACSCLEAKAKSNNEDAEIMSSTSNLYCYHEIRYAKIKRS